MALRARNMQIKYKGVGELMRSRPIILACDRSASKIGAYAESIAPVRTGQYRASFRVTSGISRSFRGRRAYGQVENTSDHAIFVEFGAQSTPAYRTMHRAVQMAQASAPGRV